MSWNCDPIPCSETTNAREIKYKNKLNNSKKNNPKAILERGTSLCSLHRYVEVQTRLAESPMTKMSICALEITSRVEEGVIAAALGF